MPGYYPIMLNVRQRPVLVIGGDRIATEKATSLLACGAQVTILSASICPEMQALAQHYPAQVTFQVRDFQAGDLAGFFVVVAATNDQDLIEALWQEATAHGQLLNIVDVPARCNFILPSILRRGQLTISVSTEGASPSLSKRIRQHLEQLFPSAYELYLQLATVARTLLRAQGVSYDQRDDFFGAFYGSPILQHLEKGEQSEALSITVALLQPYGITTTVETLFQALQEGGSETWSNQTSVTSS
ncbi:precorrin-2 oxidase [Ktedonobacter sp. SOSP1-85]|uniref:precorrin-2 dehydrogenase/sirohydrochlorin ferrochelatase family protein n=1 Tax=Ktedonobacter sp. SOSP1-85 TaxID=2778367 RepID=UPI001916954E|nr:bifunctional precorrin-2 dehydrogenase/sirohydrochlorin ferrochelatase [Ktedonobacter sp. SOSP1-85]GHO74161.1 precorrin-2 oxidase [Ktedonobacter sp. SOSP1-85]